MSDFYFPKIYKKINSDNYLINCYNHLTKIKTIHFIFISMEMLINFFQEFEIFFNIFSSDEFRLSYISKITHLFDKIPISIKLIIIVLFVIIFDILYIFLGKKKLKKNFISVSILINILELCYFRAFMLIFLNLFFTLPYIYFLISCLVLIPHIVLTINHFLFNHLYYFVPTFIDYPFDEFSSLFDIILLIIKIFLSIARNTNKESFKKLCSLIFFFEHIFFSIYYIYKLNNHSYLFMKNSFINKTKFGLFLFKTIILIMALIIGKNEINNYLFPFICLGTIFIIMIFIYLVYNPINHIKIRNDTPMENLYFYFFFLSNKNNLDFFYEDKINEHYEKCGVCDLCRKFIQYLRINENNLYKEENEKDKLIEEKKNINNNSELSSLFDIISDGENKYFNLIRRIIIDYKKKGKEAFINNSHYYINLSFLIYSDYQKNNITLSLNEKIILEVINKENKLLDNHEFQINQILFCNKFISLGKQIFNKIKDILNEEQNINKALQLIDLSILLKEMRKPKYKNNLMNHKQDNNLNSKNLILACSIIYEEIFNITLNNSQIPIRENIPQLEDIFLKNSNKNDKIISLSIDLINNNCKIIRTGKDLFPYKNNNLFDLFPLVLKEYQINLFFSSVLNKFNINKEKNDNISNNNINAINNKSTKNLKRISTFKVKPIKPIKNNKNKEENIEISLIICQNISSKIYYKLLTMKIFPLFNSNYNNYFLIFDGTYSLVNNTVITLIDSEENNKKEKLISVSDPELEKSTEIFSLLFKKYSKSTSQNKNHFNISCISKFNISTKSYIIYKIIPKDKEIVNKKIEKTNNDAKEKNPNEVEEEKKKKMIEQIIEDNASVASQQTGTNFSSGISGIAIRNKKKENLYEYGSLNKIRKIIYISTFIILLIPIIQFILLKSSLNDTSNNNYNYLNFREIFQLYYEIFTSILGYICIKTETDCERLSTIYSNQYNYDEIGGYFNFTLFLFIQSQILSQKLMEKRSNLLNIHKNIGTKNYNEIFGKNVKYGQLSQTFIGEDIHFNITYINIQFSEAILMICNSFKLLTEEIKNEPIYFMNKLYEPFSTIDKDYDQKLSNYQKEIYEMIINYRIYRQQFNAINKKLNEILNKKSQIIESNLYNYIYLDTFLVFYFISILFVYIIFFQSILIKILNFVNMTINLKSDNFNFSVSFSKKIENLEIILEIYKDDPIKAIQNLTVIYNKYQKYLKEKNKNKFIYLSKKSYKKNSNFENKKNELDNIPKNQRLVSGKDLLNLKLTVKYFLVLIIVLILLIGSFIGLMIAWKSYFLIETNLYSLIKKNLSVEASLYKSINFYYLMIFLNYTVDECSALVFYQNEEGDNDRNSILTSLYKDVQNSFNSLKEKNIIKSIDYGDIENFNCETLFDMNDENIEEIKKNTDAKYLTNLKDKLVNICEIHRITETNDIITALQKHYQNIKNGILSIKDFSYNGLIKHVYNGTLGKNTIFFNCILIYIIEITNNKPHKKGVDKLLGFLWRNIIMTEVVYICLYFLLIFLSFFFFILNIKNLCNQLFLLRKIFKINEIQDQ